MTRLLRHWINSVSSPMEFKSSPSWVSMILDSFQSRAWPLDWWCMLLREITWLEILRLLKSIDGSVNDVVSMLEHGESMEIIIYPRTVPCFKWNLLTYWDFVSSILLKFELWMREASFFVFLLWRWSQRTRTERQWNDKSLRNWILQFLTQLRWFLNIIFASSELGRDDPFYSKMFGQERESRR